MVLTYLWVRLTRMRVLPREEELTTENRMLVLDGGKIDRSAEALLNRMVLPLSLY
jgi:hypothetical protein